MFQTLTDKATVLFRKVCSIDLCDTEMEWYTENLAETFELQFLVIEKHTLLWAVLRTKPPTSMRKVRHKFPGGY